VITVGRRYGDAAEVLYHESLRIFIRSDILGLQNLMHGGFFFGVTGLYLRTRNGRFFYLPLFGYLLMLVSSLTSAVVQTFQLRHGFNYVGYLLVALLFSALLGWSTFLLVRVKNTVGISRKPSADKIYVPDDRRLLAMTRRLKLAIYLECGYYVALMVVTAVVRIQLAVVEETPLFQFLQGFIMSYTMSLHRAFIIGTGYSGAVKGDRRLLLIFFFANIIFALFFAMNLLAKLVEGVSHMDPQGIGAGVFLAQTVVLLISAYFAHSLSSYLKSLEQEHETIVCKKVRLPPPPHTHLSRTHTVTLLGWIGVGDLVEVMG